MHLFHILWAVFALVLFIMVAIPISLYLYESRPSARDILARCNSHGEVVTLLLKIALQLAFDAVSEPWFLVILLLLGGVGLFAANVVNQAYYNQRIQTTVVTCTLLYSWSVFVIFILKIIESTNYGGGFMIWATGLPFIAWMGPGVARETYSALTSGGLKGAKESQYQAHIRAVLLLMKNKNEDSKEFLRLVSFCQNHVETCTETDCPLKTAKKQLAGFIDPMNSRERIILAIQRLFVTGIKRYKSTELRIDYAAFLIEYLTANKLALEELHLANNQDPSLAQQFHIYRNRKIIEEGTGNSQRKEGEDDQQLDTVGMIAMESYSKGCVNSICGLAELITQLWEELLQDTPKLEAIFNWGTKIKRLSVVAEENWKKLGHISGNNVIIIKLVSRYLQFVSNNTEKAAEVSRIFEKKVRHLLHIRENDFSDLEKLTLTQSVGVTLFDEKTHGQIRKGNPAFESMFGFLYEELQTVYLNRLIPRLYRAGEKNPQKTWFARYNSFPDYLGQEKQYCVVTKGNQLFEVTCTTILLSGQDFMATGTIFLSRFAYRDPSSQSALLLTDASCNVTDWSANVVLFFDKSSNDDLSSLNLRDLLPGVIENEVYRKERTLYNLELPDGIVQSAMIKVDPIYSAVAYPSESNWFRIPEDRSVRGFLVHIFQGHQISGDSDRLSRASRKSLSLATVDQGDFKNIWSFVDPSLAKHKVPRHNRALESQGSSLLKQTASENYGLKIITKRLHNKALFEVFMEKEVDGTALPVDHLPPNPNKGQSIFSLSIAKVQENTLNKKSILKTNVIELVYNKQARMLNGFIAPVAAIIFLAAFYALFILAYFTKVSEVKGFQDQTQGFTNYQRVMLAISQLANLLTDAEASKYIPSSQFLPAELLQYMPAIDEAAHNVVHKMAAAFPSFNGTQVSQYSTETLSLLTQKNLGQLYAKLNINNTALPYVVSSPADFPHSTNYLNAQPKAPHPTVKVP